MRAPHNCPFGLLHTVPPVQHDLLDLGAQRDPCFRYLHVYIELLTRHVWLTPLPSKDPVLVARVVRGVPAKHQLPAWHVWH